MKADVSTGSQMGIGRKSGRKGIRQGWSDLEKTFTRRERRVAMCVVIRIGKTFILPAM